MRIRSTIFWGLVSMVYFTDSFRLFYAQNGIELPSKMTSEDFRALMQLKKR